MVNWSGRYFSIAFNFNFTLHSGVHSKTQYSNVHVGIYNLYCGKGQPSEQATEAYKYRTLSRQHTHVGP